MKLKKLNFIILFFILTYSISAQIWAPIGAKWTYERTVISGFQDTFTLGFTEFIVVKDTLIQNITCRKIIRKFQYVKPSDLTDTIVGYDPPLFIFEDSNKIYGWLVDSFYILYDFTLNIGDTLAIQNDFSYGFLDTSKTGISLLRLDTIDSVFINGISRIRQGFTYLGPPEYYIGIASCMTIGNGLTKSTAIEGIGWTYFFTPNNNIALPIHEGMLRCYTDTILGSFNCNPWPCDSILYLISGIFKVSKNKIKIIHESLDLIVIKTEIQTPLDLTIINMQGEKVFSKTLRMNNERVSIGFLPSGLYIITLQNDHVFLNQKLIR
jgi:hypothetical protein